ncbi:MAG: hypothetical protein CM1200mP3_16910 [Chloroflexota bacterium]|nr:MAG: hypothetical protein CM1200mP3_16910 [Chloroflexota bacterium]
MLLFAHENQLPTHKAFSAGGMLGREPEEYRGSF